jgi:hypothetical protein
MADKPLDIDNFDDVNRDTMLARNLYNPKNVYDASLFEDPTVRTVNQVANFLSIGGNFDFRNTIAGRALRQPDSEMIRIANQQLVEAFKKTVAQNARDNFVPKFNPKVLFDKNKDNDSQLFSTNDDFKITRRRSLLGVAEELLDAITGKETTSNPFAKQAPSKDRYSWLGEINKTQGDNQTLLKNTGKSTIKVLRNHLAYNQYAFQYEFDTGGGLGLFGRLFKSKNTKNQTGNLLLDPWKNRETTSAGGNLRSYLFDENEFQTTKELTEGYDKSEAPNENTIINNSINYKSAKKHYEVMKNVGFGDFTKIDGKFDKNTGLYSSEIEERDTFNETVEVNKNKFIWGGTLGGEDDIDGGVKRGLLYYTRKIVDSNHPYAKNIKEIPEDTNSCGDGSKSYAGPNSDKEYNKGINNIHCTPGDKNDEIYCRSFTKVDQYNNYTKTIRGKNIRDNSQTESNKGEFQAHYRDVLSKFSVLNDVGSARISPRPGLSDGLGGNSVENLNMKRLMFTIENLAWKDRRILLPDCQAGPFGGRIMWFPPYDLKFDDASQANWNETKFLGRPEPIYTYSNASRSGNLTFKMISDYPSTLNNTPDELRSLQNWEFESYVFGCYSIPQKKVDLGLTDDELSTLEKQLNDKKVELENVKSQPLSGETSPAAASTDTSNEVVVLTSQTKIEFFFENDVADVNYNLFTIGYETSSATVVGTNNNGIGNSYERWNDGKGFTQIIPSTQERIFTGLNADFVKKIDDLVAEIKASAETSIYKITIDGFASALASGQYNQRLSDTRMKSMISYLENKFSGVDIKVEKNKILQTGQAFGETNAIDNPTGIDSAQDAELRQWNKLDSTASKTSRKVSIEVKVDQDKAKKLREKQNQELSAAVSEASAEARREQEKTIKTLEDEIIDLENSLNNLRSSKFKTNRCSYFEELSTSTPFFIPKMREKLKYFHPAFHSQTPEDLNERLNFLQQCLRPGAPLSGSTVGLNTVYGRPPVCIIRIGDFFYSKVIIESIDFRYGQESITWDLNPEGIGIQPMIVDVSMRIKIIGGQSLSGPISTLQNALESNYYANSEVYDMYAKKRRVEEYGSDTRRGRVREVGDL